MKTKFAGSRFRGKSAVPRVREYLFQLPNQSVWKLTFIPRMNLGGRWVFRAALGRGVPDHLAGR